MPTVDLVYFNCGGGHRAAAHALRASLALMPEPWTVRCVDLVDLLDPLRHFERVAGFAPEDIYNKRLARGWTLGLAQELKMWQGVVRLAQAPMVRRFEAHWRRTRPDLVVSLIPNVNLALQESLNRALPGVPFVTVMTDMADHPPAFWMEAPRGQHIVCGTSRAVEQAHGLGHAATHVHRSSGMIIHPDFYTPLPFDRATELERLGFDPSRPTGVVMFGGQGSMAMAKIARALGDVQLILICGHHLPLAAKLKAQRSQAPRAVLGFTQEVRRYLQLADFFIGKPGPGSLTEALHLGLPVITTRNAWTMPQERFNAEWVREQGLGVVIGSAAKIRPAVEELLGRLGEFRARVSRLDNTAVFEVPRMLARILASNRGDACETSPISPSAAGVVTKGLRSRYTV
ncbi:hypothetical protein BH11PSE9_BH11PSE9_15320 [soil metagenome]